MKKNLKAQNNRASALIAILIISALMIAAATGYITWLQQSSKAAVHHSTSRRALDQAEFGIDSALVKLREPGFLQYGSSTTISVPFENGRMDIAYMRQNPNDINVVQVLASAYYYLATGLDVDPQIPTQHAQKAVVAAKIRLNFIGDYFAIVPDSLKVAYGTDLGNGSVYSRNLEFETGTGPHTRVKQAYYVETVSPPDYLTFVDFTDSSHPNAQQLGSSPNLVYLNDATKAFYQSKATDWAAGAGHPMFGTVDPPSGDHVYFCAGDLHLGTVSEDLRVNGYWVIYSTGNVYIHNNIFVNPNSWIGILAHGAITIAADAPGTIELNGNFVTDGAIRSELPSRPTGQLTFNGGFLAHEGADFSTVWQGNRTYSYVTRSDSTLLLPNFTELIESQIIRGKYSN